MGLEDHYHPKKYKNGKPCISVKNPAIEDTLNI